MVISSSNKEVKIFNFKEKLVLTSFKSDEKFAVDLIKKIGVASVPGSSFFKEDINSYIRFHFAKSDSVLESALEKLSHIHEHF